MSVRPHPTKGKNWWQIDIGRGKDRQRPAFKGSFEEAARFEADIRQQRPEEVHTSAPKIKELFVPFLAWYKKEAATRTINDIRFSIDLYLTPWFGNIQPIRLTLALFNNFKDSLLQQGLSPATINKHLNYFSTLLKWATAHGHCQPLPFKIPRFPKKKTVARPKTPLTQRQIDAIYKQLTPEYRLPYLLMADCGLRVAEAFSITAEDIDEANSTFTFLGKGNKYRTVPFLSDRFEKELTKALDTHITGHLSISKQTKRPLVTMWKPLQQAAKAAGITRKINHHLLRHSFATLAAQNGMNPHALQRILGHSSIETTNKIYTNVSHDFVGDEARKLRKNKNR